MNQQNKTTNETANETEKIMQFAKVIPAAVYFIVFHVAAKVEVDLLEAFFSLE
jgi:hypothetical protein